MLERSNERLVSNSKHQRPQQIDAATINPLNDETGFAAVFNILSRMTSLEDSVANEAVTGYDKVCNVVAVETQIQNLLTRISQSDKIVGQDRMSRCRKTTIYVAVAGLFLLPLVFYLYIRHSMWGSWDRTEYVVVRVVGGNPIKEEYYELDRQEAIAFLKWVDSSSSYWWLARDYPSSATLYIHYLDKNRSQIRTIWCYRETAAAREMALRELARTNARPVEGYEGILFGRDPNWYLSYRYLVRVD